MAMSAARGAVMASSSVRVSSGNRASPAQCTTPALLARPSAKAAFSYKRSTVVAQRSVVSVSATATAPAVGSDLSRDILTSKYDRSWSSFELGANPVYWEPAQPSAGEVVTIWFNPDMTQLEDTGNVAFNGGFNGPFMCGGEPRPMALKSRGSSAPPLYSIRVNVPKHASFLEFGFTDGVNWDEGYKLEIVPLPENIGRDLAYFNDKLATEMSVDGACDSAIFPDPAPLPLSCPMPGGVGLVGQSCDLDIVRGCTNPDDPDYNPMATEDDTTCSV
eukprot:1097426-Prorocentrum_minimum.AAC.1